MPLPARSPSPYEVPKKRRPRSQSQQPASGQPDSPLPTIAEPSPSRSPSPDGEAEQPQSSTVGQASRMPSVKLPRKGKSTTSGLTGVELQKKLHPGAPIPHQGRLGANSNPKSLHDPDLNTCSPGPAYNPNLYAVQSSPKSIRFAHAKNNDRFRPHSESPGPVYFVEESWRKKPVSFSHSNRFWRKEEEELAPGPADYLPNDFKLSTKRSPSTSVKMSDAPRLSMGTRETKEMAIIRDRQEKYAAKHEPPAKKKKHGVRVHGGPMKANAPSTFGTPHTMEAAQEGTDGPGPAAYQRPMEQRDPRKLKGPTLNTARRGPWLGGPGTDVGFHNPSVDCVKPRSPSPLLYYTS